jgi:hypothetical protein
MSEANDIRSLLASKSRAKVAPRDTSLNSNRSSVNNEALAEVDDELDTQANTTLSTTPDLSDIQAEVQLDTQANTTLSTTPDLSDIQAEAQLDTQANATAAATPDLSGLQAELDTLPTVGKRLAVHLEQNIRTDLLKLCDANDITPEIFIEAAIVSLQQQPELLNEIVTDAKVRLAQRKRAGLIRRTLVMVQKYGS